MFCLGGRKCSQRTDRVQGTGSCLAETQADRELNRDYFARVTSKRRETGSLECRATRDSRRIRNRYRDQAGRLRALRFCHVDPGALFELELLSVIGMRHKQTSSRTDESVAPTSRTSRNCSQRRRTATSPSRSHGVKACGDGNKLDAPTRNGQGGFSAHDREAAD